jgi:hypothetical protein
VYGLHALANGGAHVAVRLHAHARRPAALVAVLPGRGLERKLAAGNVECGNLCVALARFFLSTHPYLNTTVPSILISVALAATFRTQAIKDKSNAWESKTAQYILGLPAQTVMES